MLRVFNKKEKKKKNMEKMGKLFFVIILAKLYFSETFGTQLSFDTCCALKSVKAKEM